MRLVNVLLECTVCVTGILSTTWMCCLCTGIHLSHGDYQLAVWNQAGLTKKDTHHHWNGEVISVLPTVFYQWIRFKNPTKSTYQHVTISALQCMKAFGGWCFNESQ